MALISWVNRIYGSVLIDWFHVIIIFSYCSRKLREMPENTLKLSGKVAEFYFAQPVGTLHSGGVCACVTEAACSPAAAAVASRCQHTADSRRTQSDARGPCYSLTDRGVHPAREAATCSVSVETVAGHAQPGPGEPARHRGSDGDCHQTGS